VLAGWIASDFHNELTLLVDGLGIGESVALRGPVVGAEKLALMESSDAFVLPSHSEGQPLAVLEAWALGLPAVISAECNLPEGALAGAAVECRPNPQSIANSLAQVMAMSEAELAEMGLRGRKLVEREFSWRIVTQRFTSLYLWAIGGGQRPSWIRSI
jgi:poly(glycerol-phosphate) alpha-glucosyltransferase